MEQESSPLPTAAKILREGLLLARDRNIGAVDIERAHLLLDFARELREGSAQAIREMEEDFEQVVAERDAALRQAAEWKRYAEHEVREGADARRELADLRASDAVEQADVTRGAGTQSVIEAGRVIGEPLAERGSGGMDYVTAQERIDEAQRGKLADVLEEPTAMILRPADIRFDGKRGGGDVPCEHCGEPIYPTIRHGSEVYAHRSTGDVYCAIGDAFETDAMATPQQH